MAPLLLVLFFLSGSAALIFQTLWFRLAGLAFGNSVWASSLVLASFMGGLALGNALSAARGRRLTDPVRVYGWLEILVATTGLGLVLFFPRLTAVMAPSFGRLVDSPGSLQGLRFVTAFVLMLLPATAMGATLPILVRTLVGDNAQFGPALGRLYGWNTLGAVAGALAGELVLIERLGVRGTGIFAAGLNILAASLAFALARRLPPLAPGTGPGETPPTAIPRGALGLLFAAALSGGILLALEVLWFRFLQLFVVGTSQTFAVMLAVVLAGIGVGGLLAGALLAERRRALDWLPVLSLLGGVLTLSSYLSLSSLLDSLSIAYTQTPWETACLSAWLMLPTCLVSGILFPLMGQALKDRLESATFTAGLLTLSNTTGSMGGALAGGFLLLPSLGIEPSFVTLAMAYGLVAALVLASAPETRARSPIGKGVLAASAMLFTAFLAFFPFGFMQRTYWSRIVHRFSNQDRLAASREGLTETLFYLRRDLLGEPLSYRLVTNGLSMSGTGFFSDRYMKAFVYWPAAIHPKPRRALMISYGVGSTAKALTDSRPFESITLVDTSKDVFEMGRLLFPPPDFSPLDDPRVRLRVEDGRHFLLTTRDSFDVITGEPPPPTAAGIVNLYSQEYFGLIRERLNEGGIATYWLPVYQIEAGTARAIVKGFCNAFDDCSLWSGSGLEWILVGTRNARGPGTEEQMSWPWRDPVLGASLRSIGLETPAHLGALFLADAQHLRGMTAGVEPLVDDRPARLSHHLPQADSFAFYESMMDASQARSRFENSPAIRRLWPASLIDKTLPRFAEVQILNEYSYAHRPRARFRSLRQALTQTSSQILPLVIMGSSDREQGIVDRAVEQGVSNALVDYLLGVRALSRRDYLFAEQQLEKVEAQEPAFAEIRDLRALALCLAGEGARASGLLRTRLHPADQQATAFWKDPASCS